MITYTNTEKITARAFADVLSKSGIHRPVDDLARLEQMLENSSCLWTAWDGDKLVGVARALSDFSYACYLSDLAVDKTYQRQGIGRQLVEHLKAQMGEDVSLVLLAAPSAMDYYPKISFKKANNAFIIPRKPF